MPIFIKDSKWSDSLQKVVISVPLKGIAPSKVDVVLSSEYLKLSFPPYIFECFFYKPVLEDDATCVAASGIMQVTVTKVEQEDWPQLTTDSADDKAVASLIRERAFERQTERLQAAGTAAKATRRANEQLGLREQMKLEEADQARVEAAKQAERDSAMRELEEFRLRQQRLRDDAKRLFREETAAAAAAAAAEADDKEAAEPSGEIFQQEEQPMPQPQRPQQQQRQSLESVLGPAVRQPGRIGVSFTARVFPTPERESQKALEEQWLSKQAERRRLADAATAIAAADEPQPADGLSQQERDPVWLRDKGNRLFAAGSYQAAVNAYSHAIELKSELHSLFSNRAACHLKLGNCFKALEDSSRALELLQPPVEQNRLARVRAHCRRAAALCGLDAHAEAAVELAEAARLAPDSPEIRADLDRVRGLAAADDGGGGDAEAADGLDDVDD